MGRRNKNTRGHGREPKERKVVRLIDDRFPPKPPPAKQSSNGKKKIRFLSPKPNHVMEIADEIFGGKYFCVGGQPFNEADSQRRI